MEVVSMKTILIILALIGSSFASCYFDSSLSRTVCIGYNFTNWTTNCGNITNPSSPNTTASGNCGWTANFILNEPVIPSYSYLKTNMTPLKWQANLISKLTQIASKSLITPKLSQEEAVKWLSEYGIVLPNNTQIEIINSTTIEIKPKNNTVINPIIKPSNCSNPRVDDWYVFSQGLSGEYNPNSIAQNQILDNIANSTASEQYRCAHGS